MRSAFSWQGGRQDVYKRQPFRRRGLLRQMAEDMEKGKIQSAYTARKTKMIGHMEGHFHLAHREQDAKKFFYFFDGNINVVTHR